MLCGSSAIEYQSQIWGKLIASTANLPSLNPEQVEVEVANHCRLLLVHNPITHNFQKLVLHFVDLINTTNAERVAASASNVACLLSFMLKYIAEIASPSTLRTLFEVSPALPVEVQGMQTLLPTFVDRLLSFVSENEVSEALYLVHLEIIKLLLVCNSTQLYTSQTAVSDEMNPISSAIMDLGHLGAPVMQALLQIAFSRPPLPSRFTLYTHEAATASMFQFVRRAAATLLWFPLQTYNLLINPSAVERSSPLGDHALLLLLVLAHYPTHDGQAATPYQQAISTLHDSEEATDAEGGRSTQVSRSVCSVSFRSAYSFFAKGLSDEAVALLLYTMLHRCKAFQEYVLVRGDVETLLVPLLSRLYGTTRRQANQLYMLQIIVLILSQDTSFSANIHKVVVPSVPWYSERVLSRVSLGSLVYIVLLRSTLLNFSNASDLYLPTNTLAALANMAPQVSGLHAHAAQRLVGLFAALAKRHAKLSKHIGDGAITQQAGAVELQVMLDFLRIILEIMNAVLVSGLQRNPELVYALLHRQEVFAQFRGQPRLQQLVDNIQVVIEFFNSRLEASRGGEDASASEWGVGQLMELVSTHSSAWRTDRLRPLPELRFVYEEEAHPEEFFVPYVWSLVVARSSVPWALSAIALFSAVAQPAAGTTGGSASSGGAQGTSSGGANPADEEGGW